MGENTHTHTHNHVCMHLSTFFRYLLEPSIELGFKKKLVKLLGTIENLGKHLIFALLVSNFSFWLYSQQKKAGTTVLQVSGGV